MNEIVKLIGRKRAIVLGVMLAVNAALAAVYFLLVMPAQAGAAERLAAVGGQIASLQQNIQSVKQEVEDYHHNLPGYLKLKDSGFFLPQDRFQVVRDLERIKDEAGATATFSFVISEVQKLTNAEADAANMQLILSQIKLEKINALLDSDFYDLTTTVLSKFPQHLRLAKFTIKRTVPSVGEEVLKKVIDGEEVSLVAAEVDFQWVTIIPKPEEPQSTGWTP